MEARHYSDRNSAKKRRNILVVAAAKNLVFVTYHGLGACFTGRSSEHSTGSDFGKLVEDGFIVVFGPHVITGRRHGPNAWNGGARKGAGGKDSEGHGCCCCWVLC